MKPGQVGSHRQAQLISERHLVFGQDRRQFGEGHHAQTLHPASVHCEARNVPGAACGCGSVARGCAKLRPRSAAGRIGRMDGEIGREPQYEVFADEFLDHATDGFFNACYDRPACLALLGDVAGKRVLDAACGPGLYAGELVRRGAQVIGFDHSPRMVEICRARVGPGDGPFEGGKTATASELNRRLPAV